MTKEFSFPLESNFNKDKTAQPSLLVVSRKLMPLRESVLNHLPWNQGKIKYKGIMFMNDNFDDKSIQVMLRFPILGPNIYGRGLL
jgi:hypothetical protein